MPFSPDAVLGGRYVLAHLVEDDGLTQAWTATDQVLARPVMVDVLPADAPPAAHDAFVAAVAAAARLGHTGVVATYDSGTVDGSPYVVTERPRGASLADVVEHSGKLPAARVIGIGRQVARALEAAHRLGVVHGGVAPTTVVLGEDDRARLARFAASGTRARLRFGGPGSLAGDVQDLARTLDAVLAGSGPKKLAALIADARPGGPVTTAAAFAEALDAIAPPPGDPEPPPRAASAAPPAVVPRLPAESPKTPAAGTPPVGAGSRGPMLTGVAVGVVLVIAIAVGGFVLANGGGGGGKLPGGTTAHGGDLAIAAVHSFNPLGRPGPTENEGQVSRLDDGDPATVWSTSEYQGEQFGNLKPGTGVYLVLDASHSLHQLTVTSPSRGWMFRVYVAAKPGTDLGGWGQPASAPVTVTNDVTQVNLTNASGGAVLVWITDLGQPLAHPDVTGLPYRVDIGELAVR